jgi:HK97 gp10 family phage protein
MSRDSVTCKVTGLDGVCEKILSIEPKIARSLLRKSLKTVGVFWVDAVKAHVPVLRGDLRDSIVAKVSTRKGKAQSAGLPTGTVTVGPGYGTGERTDGKKSVPPGVYGMWVEFGLKTKIYPKEPFMRPTFDTTGEQAVDIFASTMMSGLEEAIKDGD